MQTPTPAIAPVQFVPALHAGVPAAAGQRCSTCSRRALCLPAGYAEPELQAMDALMFARRKVKAGERLYRQGENFHFVYALHSGTFKSVAAVHGGREQVTGFHLAGDVLGLDALAEGRHASEASALEDSEVCAIPYRQLAELSAGSANVRNAVSHRLGAQIVGEQRALLLLASMNAEERVASFLLDISARLQARGYSAREFHLRMSRAEIGSYLGLSLETVSRVLSAFQSQGLVAVDKKHVRILQMEALARSVERELH